MHRDHSDGRGFALHLSGGAWGSRRKPILLQDSGYNKIRGLASWTEVCPSKSTAAGIKRKPWRAITAHDFDEIAQRVRKIRLKLLIMQGFRPLARTLHWKRLPPHAMTSNLASVASSFLLPCARRFRGLAVLLAACALSSALFAQADQNAAPADGANAGGRVRRGQNGSNGGGRENFNPEEMQQRMMTALREQLDVTDDAEWRLISDRITAVTELRRTAGLGGGGMMGAFRGGAGAGGGAGGGRGGRGGVAASPEQDSLRQAIIDKLPEAEIKSRLTRLREVRKANEEKLTKTQEELRAVLGVRQEAVAVMAGLLP